MTLVSTLVLVIIKYTMMHISYCHKQDHTVTFGEQIACTLVHRMPKTLGYIRKNLQGTRIKVWSAPYNA